MTIGKFMISARYNAVIINQLRNRPVMSIRVGIFPYHGQIGVDSKLVVVSIKNDMLMTVMDGTRMSEEMFAALQTRQDKVPSPLEYVRLSSQLVDVIVRIW
jgi:hypothetical protein